MNVGNMYQQLTGHGDNHILFRAARLVLRLARKTARVLGLKVVI